MKHINVRNKVLKNGKWFYSGSSDGYLRSIESHIKKNKNRMYVNGKYISKSHPLHKPGNYKTFEEAAFQSLGKYKTVKKGFVYVITNKAWKGWIKIGRAADVMDRFKHYQTFSPFRDYQLKYGKLVEDCKVLENKWKQKLKNNYKCRNEWYKINFLDAIFILENIIKNEEKKS